MFTGIVQGVFTVESIETKTGLLSIGIQLSDALCDGLNVGASVSVDGVCLTVTGNQANKVFFDIMSQTLTVTSLNYLKEGDRVNIERSARQGEEIGGHLMSGHVDSLATIIKIEESENNKFISYSVAPEKIKYIFDKGFIGLNGCSLTVAEINKENNVFKICYIPETLKMTTHGEKIQGNVVNLEVDRQTQTIVDTVEAYLKTSNFELVK